MSLISLSGGSALLELTDRCYTGCNVGDGYCYKKLSISSKASGVATKILKNRIDWIKKYTDATDITVLGGEPLLHENFIVICEYILSMGFTLSIITSGVVSKLAHEKANLEFMLDLYRRGKISIELSFHYKRNTIQYAEIVKRIISIYEENRKAQQADGVYRDTNHDLVSTAVIPHYVDEDEAVKLSNDLLIHFHWQYKRNDPNKDGFLDFYRKRYVLKSRTQFYSVSSMDSWTGFRAKVVFVGESEVKNTANGATVSLPEGGTCPAIDSETLQDSIRLDSFLIRTDGGVVYAKSQCIGMPSPLINVDTHTTKNAITEALRGSLGQIKSHVYIFNRLKAKENCDDGGVEEDCTACPFDKMCTPCWRQVRPWQKIKTPL